MAVTPLGVDSCIVISIEPFEVLEPEKMSDVVLVIAAFKKFPPRYPPNPEHSPEPALVKFPPAPPFTPPPPPPPPPPSFVVLLQD